MEGKREGSHSGFLGKENADSTNSEAKSKSLIKPERGGSGLEGGDKGISTNRNAALSRMGGHFRGKKKGNKRCRGKDP